MSIRTRRIIQIIFIIGLTIYAIYKVNFEPGPTGPNCDFTDRVPPRELIYVEHARCRMLCREVDQRLVEKVYLDGTINCEKSSYKDGHPRYALEKRDDRGDKIRVIVEEEDGKHVIITVIRLGKDDKCSCS